MFSDTRLSNIFFLSLLSPSHCSSLTRILFLIFSAKKPACIHSLFVPVLFSASDNKRKALRILPSLTFYFVERWRRRNSHLALTEPDLNTGNVEQSRRKFFELLLNSCIRVLKVITDAVWSRFPSIDVENRCRIDFDQSLASVWSMKEWANSSPGFLPRLDMRRIRMESTPLDAHKYWCNKLLRRQAKNFSSPVDARRRAHKGLRETWTSWTQCSCNRFRPTIFLVLFPTQENVQFTSDNKLKYPPS